MAVTNEKSNLYTNTSAVPPVLNKASLGGHQPVKQMGYHIQGAAAGDANSTIEICTVPMGSRLDMHQSSIHFSAYGTARVLKVGWRAYQKADGTIVAEDDDGLFAALDVSAAGFKNWVEAPTLGAGLDADHTRLFEGPAVLFATVTGGTIPAAAKTVFRVVYAQSD